MIYTLIYGVPIEKKDKLNRENIFPRISKTNSIFNINCNVAVGAHCYNLLRACYDV